MCRSAAFDDAVTTVHTARVLCPSFFYVLRSTHISNVGIGALLVQWQDGAKRIVAYESRTLPLVEALSAVSLRRSVSSSKQTPLPLSAEPTGGLRQQEFDMTVVCKSGKQHFGVDCLS